MAIKRKRGIVILTAGILLVIAAGVAFFGYQLLFNNLDEERKAAIKDEVNQITDSIVSEIQNNDAFQSSETIDLNTEGNGNRSEDSENKNETGELPGNQSTSKEDNVARIIASYENGFKKLESQGNSILDRLIEEAKADYYAMEASGGGRIDLVKLVVTYNNKAKVYESGLDSSVTLLLSRMSEDLKSAGMSVSEVKSYIESMETKYAEQKEEMRDLLFKKAKEYL